MEEQAEKREKGRGMGEQERSRERKAGDAGHGDRGKIAAETAIWIAVSRQRAGHEDDGREENTNTRMYTRASENVNYQWDTPRGAGSGPC